MQSKHWLISYGTYLCLCFWLPRFHVACLRCRFLLRFLALHKCVAIYSYMDWALLKDSGKMWMLWEPLSGWAKHFSDYLIWYATQWSLNGNFKIYVPTANAINACTPDAVWLNDAKYEQRNRIRRNLRVGWVNRAIRREKKRNPAYCRSGRIPGKSYCEYARLPLMHYTKSHTYIADPFLAFEGSELPSRKSMPRKSQIITHVLLHMA